MDLKDLLFSLNNRSCNHSCCPINHQSSCNLDIFQCFSDLLQPGACFIEFKPCSGVVFAIQENVDDIKLSFYGVYLNACDLGAGLDVLSEPLCVTEFGGKRAVDPANGFDLGSFTTECLAHESFCKICCSNSDQKVQSYEFSWLDKSSAFGLTWSLWE